MNDNIKFLENVKQGFIRRLLEKIVSTFIQKY